MAYALLWPADGCVWCQEAVGEKFKSMGTKSCTLIFCGPVQRPV